ncbi:MAG: hypothetical protein GXO89_07010 [Chlorobi bacterium]|nr:hypothetical protein [Chlorobiota bacterium]
MNGNNRPKRKSQPTIPIEPKEQPFEFRDQNPLLNNNPFGDNAFVALDLEETDP